MSTTLDRELTARTSVTGVAPLTARAEPWQLDLLDRPEVPAELVAEHGSPLNLIEPAPMARNLAELREAAASHGLELGVYFARKANKALGLVARAVELGAGVDVASEQELQQVLGLGVPAERIVVTAAVKPRRLLELCAGSGALVVIDNADELAAAREVAMTAGVSLPVAFRLAVSGSDPARPPTRFGISPADIPALAEGGLGEPGRGGGLALRGLHFHLDGYDPGDRAAALRTAIGLADELDGDTAGGDRRISFIDMGGGIPMRYLEDEGQWHRFWEAMRAGLGGSAPPVTYLGNGLGLHAGTGGVSGSPAVYPVAQRLIRGEWIDRVLGAPAGAGQEGATIASALAARGIELRCEPGRALLDGCGMTLARVEFRKQGAAGDRLVGLAMNRTQCRTAAEDSMIDPWLVRSPGSEPSEPFEGYLVGAYCIERELITWRRLRFSEGVSVGDLIAFPNTAGYFMHILESSSHQMPLARNLLLEGGRPADLDPIDL